MATLEDVKTQINSLALAVQNEATEVGNAIQALKDQLAQGSAVTAEDLDGLVTRLAIVQNAVQAIIEPPGGAEPQSGGGPDDGGEGP